MNYKYELLNETVELADLDLRIDVLQKEILDYIRGLEGMEQNKNDVLNLSKMYHDLYKLQEDKKKLIPKVYVGYRYLNNNK